LYIIGHAKANGTVKAEAAKVVRPAAPPQPKVKVAKPQESSEDDESSEEDSRPPAKTGRS
jgi:hypothetical protein